MIGRILWIAPACFLEVTALAPILTQHYRRSEASLITIIKTFISIFHVFMFYSIVQLILSISNVLIMVLDNHTR